MPRKSSNRKRGGSKSQRGGTTDPAVPAVPAVPEISQDTLQKAGQIAQKVMGSMMQSNGGQGGGGSGKKRISSGGSGRDIWIDSGSSRCSGCIYITDDTAS